MAHRHRHCGRVGSRDDQPANDDGTPSFGAYLRGDLVLHCLVHYGGDAARGQQPGAAHFFI